MNELTARFVGRPSKTERRFEAHLFLTCHHDQVDYVVMAARRRRFRLSSRKKVLDSGAHDILLTRNSDDAAVLERHLRALADDLVEGSVHVYRLRLESMVLDEVVVRK